MVVPDPAALNELLHRILADQERGEVHPVEHYGAQHPELADFLAGDDLIGGTGSPAPLVDAGTAIGRFTSLGPYRLLHRLGQNYYHLLREKLHWSEAL